MYIVEAIINRLFSRTDCYAEARIRDGKVIYVPSYYSDASTPLLPVDRDVVQAHLQGTRTIGSYVLNEDKCRFAVVDVDVYEGDPVAVGWVAALEVRGRLLAIGVPTEAMLLEFSGRKGWHVWLLFQELVEAATVRRVLQTAVQQAGFSMHGSSQAERDGFPGHLELFPKEDRAPRFGSLIKLPLGIHQATKARSCFYDVSGQPLPDESLVAAVPMSQSLLARIAENFPEPPPPTPPARRYAPGGEPLALSKRTEVCEHVRWMEENPSLLTYQQWQNLGILLAHYEGGGERFHEVSATEPRYDYEACESLIRHTRSRGFNPPRCGSLGCGRDCGVKNPTLLRIPNRYRKARVRDQRQEEKPIEECREELAAVVDELLQDVRGVNLLIAPCGLGKTTQLLQAAEARGLRVLTLAPDHGQAPHCLNAYPGTHLKSRSKLDKELNDPFWCLHVADIERLQQRNFSGSGAFCRSCAKIDRCPYTKMLQQARRDSHVVAVHAHLGRIDPRVLNSRDLVVVDEPIWSWYRREEQLLATDVSSCYQAMCALAQSTNKPAAAALAGHLQALLALRCDESYVTDGPISLDRRFVAAWEAHARATITGRNVIPDLVNASEHATPIVRGDGYSYVHVSSLHENVVILDAFGSREFYEQVTGREVRVWQPKSTPKQRTVVRQVLDGAYPNASLIPRVDGSRQTVLNTIETIRSQHAGVVPAFVCTKQFEAILREHYPDAAYLHFGNLVGRDDFRDKSLVIRIGYQMLNYKDLARNTRVLFGLQWDDAEVVKQLEASAKVWLPLNYANGREGYEVLAQRFDNQYVQMYYEQVVLGEMRQGDGRCRPYQNPGDYYIICNLPTRLRVDEAIILKQPTAAQAVAAAVAGLACGERFSSTDIDVEFSTRTIRRELGKLSNVEKRGTGWVRVR